MDLGAANESRTRDLVLGKHTLYQLSYSRMNKYSATKHYLSPELGSYPVQLFLSRQYSSAFVISQVARIWSLAVDPTHCAFMVSAITHFHIDKV